MGREAGGRAEQARGGAPAHGKGPRHRMTALSYSREGSKGFTIFANPIFLLDGIGGERDLVFEVRPADGKHLGHFRGTDQNFYLAEHPDRVFTGRVETVDEVAPSHPTLQRLDERVIRVRIHIYGGPATLQ